MTCHQVENFLFKFFLIFVLFSVHSNVSGQVKNIATEATAPQNDALKVIVAAIDSFATRLPPEKIFVHTDKPVYALNDTLWFKTYLFDGNSLAYSAKSSIIYVELYSDSSRLVKRISIPGYKGMAWGQISLDDSEFDEGFYTLRAYTNWMQNLDSESFFTKRIYISDAKGKHWTISQANILKTEADKLALYYAVKFQYANREPFGFKTLNWRVLDGKKVLNRGTFETLNNDMKGSLAISEKSGPLFLSVKEKSNENPVQLNFPLIYTDTLAADVQFMPESGYLVAEAPCNIAFKAINSKGYGIAVSGKIKNKNNEEVSTFETSHKGMGVFTLTPETGGEYQAVVEFAGGKQKVFKLPTVKAQGSVLQVINKPSADSLRVYVLFSEGLVTGKVYKLVGIQQGEMKFSVMLQASKQRFSMYIPKEIFNTGIVHLTLFNEENEPLNERLAFIHRKDFLNVQLEQQKQTVSTRDSVPFTLKVNTSKGTPSRVFFSLAVTDNAQVKQNEDAGNILSEVFLESELKGYIEDPGAYFNGTENAEKNIDFLLLTQGWVGYQWENILKKDIQPQFKPQSEPVVSGRVLNLSNKPIANAKVLLMGSGKNKFILDTVTNVRGEFVFRKLPALDSVTYFVQARNAKNKGWNVQLLVDEFKPAAFASPHYPVEVPWYINVDSVSRKLAENNDKAYQESLRNGRLIKEVVINIKRVRNTKNLNGPGEADEVINEKDFADAGKMGLEELMLKKIKGLSLRLRKADQYFYLNDKRVRFIVDGVDLDRLFFPGEPPMPMEYYHYLNSLFSNIKGDDLLGFEVMYNNRYTSKYTFQYPDSAGVMSRVEYAFIEITTRSGNGISIRTNFGTALHRPIPLSWPKNFYEPRYSISPALKQADRRSTIAWIPNLLTDTNGTGKFSFYTADSPSEYTLIVQGSDMLGNFGYRVMKMKVKEK